MLSRESSEQNPIYLKNGKNQFIKEIAEIDQPSAKWTTIQILNELLNQLDEAEKLIKILP